MSNRHRTSLFLIILFLIPAVSALDVNIENNKLTINGKFASIVNIYYEDNSALIDVIDFTGQCRNIVCNGKYIYDLNKIKLKLDKSYFFNVYDYKDKKTKRFNFGFRATNAVIGKGLYEGCNSNNECASGNCVGPNKHCCPIDKECFFYNPESVRRCLDVGEPLGFGNVCSGLNIYKGCSNLNYCETIGNAECHANNKWEEKCEKQGKKCENGMCVAVEKPAIIGNINVKTLDYLREEKESIGRAKPAFGLNDFYKNSLPAEKHPVILYTDINVIKDRITREPYKTWWNQVIKEANWVSLRSILNWNRIEKAEFAKFNAFVYAVNKTESYGDRARDLLLNMDKGGYSKEHFEDIDSLVYFSEAYDMLNGANYNFEKSKLDICSYKTCTRLAKNLWRQSCTTTYACDTKIRGLLKEQIKQVAETTIFELGGDTLTRKNNLHIMRYSAVGIAAIVLHDNTYFDNAMNGGSTFGLIGDGVDFVTNIVTSIVGIFSKKTADNMKSVRLTYGGLDSPINHQIIDDIEGGWREGPSYLAYSFTDGMPFLKTMKNAGVVNDWLSVNRLRNTLIDWAIAVNMPNGAMPPIDDSNLGTSYAPSGYLDNAYGNWLWKKTGYQTFWDDARMKVDAIAYYDDKIGEQEPQLYPTQYLQNTGIFFRNNWKSDAIYLAFLGENGRAIDNELLGYTHEHKDTMSFILYAYGKYLALDSGYIDWDNKDRVANPKNHNVVLINNDLASEGTPIESDFFSTDYLEYGKIKNNLGHERGILFVDKNYFLVFDVLKSSSNRNYNFLLHGNGLQGTSSLNKISSGKAEWVQGDVGLLAYLLPKPNDVINFIDAEHCNTWPNVEKHTYMSVLRNGKNIGFLSLLYPSKGRSYPETNKIGDILEIKKDDWRALAFVNENNNLIELNEIKTDASRFFVKLKNNKIDYLFADDVTKIYLNNEKLINSDVKTTVAIKFNGNDLEINYKDNGNVLLNKKPAEVLYNNRISNNLISSNGVNL